MTWSPAGDFETVCDGLTTVTLRRHNGTELTTENALRRMVTTREAAASGGKYTAGDVRWHLDQIDSVAYISYGTLSAPRVGERIVDSGNTIWTILAVEEATLGSRFGCVCRNMAVYHGLNEKVNIERSTQTKGVHGEPLLTWEARAYDVLAKVHVSGDSQTDERSARTHRRTATVYFAEDVDLDPQRDRIVQPDGTVWMVESYSMPESIDQLPRATVTDDQWPL